MRNAVILFLVFLSAVSVVSAGGNSEEQAPAEDSSSAFEAPEATTADDVRAQLEEIGVQAIQRDISAQNFTLATLQGPNMSLEDYRGRMVLLNFWATWCAPCVQEMPSMQSLYDRLKDRGLEVVAVNVQEDRDVVAAFMEEHGLSFPVLLDPSGRTSYDYAVRGLPTSYIIGRDGKLIGMKVGFHLWDEANVVSTFESLLEQDI